MNTLDIEKIIFSGIEKSDIIFIINVTKILL